MITNDPLHVHVVGAAGVGMSALAQALVDAGYRVTGSDRYVDQGQAMPVLEQLRLAGVTLLPQDGSGITAATACIAVSTAIEEDNADLRRAQALGVEVVHRAAMIARIVAGRRLLAVTGTAGKTTVTGMIGHLCAEAGMDPVVINGGVVTNWQSDRRVGSVRKGGGDLAVIEADESDRSLLSFQPHYSVITNITKDHFELDEVVRLFRAFRERTAVWSVLGPQAAGVLDDAAPAELEISRRADGPWFRHDGNWYPSPMPGRHNAENAWIAVSAARALGLEPARIAAALATFRGIHRRLEVVARGGGVVVLDDYAHNPAKIAASWRAAAEQADRVIGIWRPHGYGPLSLLFDELADAFTQVAGERDVIYILPVYYAGGTAKKTNDAERLVETLAARGKQAHFAPDYEWLRGQLRAGLKSGDVVLGMGARDPELPSFLQHLFG